MQRRDQKQLFLQNCGDAGKGDGSFVVVVGSNRSD
jgi:hypothetical protein